MKDGALSDLKVVEYDHLVSGPFCAKLLADLGAEVIKVEDREGDEARRLRPFLDNIPDPECSGLFLYLNANKLGVTLNLKTSTGMKLFRELVREADIFVENNMPETMKQLGLDYDTLSNINPRLIVTSITPFGQTGPYRDYKSSELISFHMCGLSQVTPQDAKNGQEPLKIGGNQAAFYTGLTAAMATMCAVYSRQQTGRGQHIDISEMEAPMNNVAQMLCSYVLYGEIATRFGRPMWTYPIKILPCKDGYIGIQMHGEHQWQALVKLMGNPEWADDELFKDAASRAEYQDALEPLLLDWLKDQPKQDLAREAQALHIPLLPVNEPEDILNCEHLSAREFFVEIEHPKTGKLKYPSTGVKFSRTPYTLRRPAPLLGQHNAEIYCGRFGYSKEDLVKMHEGGII